MAHCQTAKWRGRPNDDFWCYYVVHKIVDMPEDFYSSGFPHLLQVVLIEERSTNDGNSWHIMFRSHVKC